MVKTGTYRQQMALIEPWFTQVVRVVKNELKIHHMALDSAFCRRHFLGQHPARVSVESMAQAYAMEIAEGNEGLAEYIAMQWVVHHRAIYDFFEKQLHAISPNFDQLDALDSGLSWRLMEEGVARFGAVSLYLFVVLNAVVFPEPVVQALREQALQGQRSKRKESRAHESALR